MRISDWSSDVCSSDLYPVVSGNVSLYNETNGQAILPTPVIGGVGLIDDLDRIAGTALSPGETLVLVGETEPDPAARPARPPVLRSEEHTSELQLLMRISYAVFCLKKKKNRQKTQNKQ